MTGFAEVCFGAGVDCTSSKYCESGSNVGSSDSSISIHKGSGEGDFSIGISVHGGSVNGCSGGDCSGGSYDDSDG